MARNKHPEETVGRILDVASRLFLEKGYEHTSIQDIINNLGGLSKGAIYHHFKSKEEILIAVTDRMTSESNHMLAQIRDASGLNGREKLRWIFKASINRPVQNFWTVFYGRAWKRWRRSTFFRLFGRGLKTDQFRPNIRNSWRN